jgi:hypothetical protein
MGHLFISSGLEGVDIYKVGNVPGKMTMVKQNFFLTYEKSRIMDVIVIQFFHSKYH